MPDQIFVYGEVNGFNYQVVCERNAGENDESFVRRTEELAKKAGFAIQDRVEEQTANIDTVIKRLHEGTDKDGKPKETYVVDFYPKWNAAGTFGAYKYCSKWINSAKDQEDFEAATGLLLDEMPEYQAQAPYVRKQEKVGRNEVRLESPITVARKSGGMREQQNGTMMQTWDFSRYVTSVAVAE